MTKHVCNKVYVLKHVCNKYKCNKMPLKHECNKRYVHKHVKNIKLTKPMY